MTQRTWSGDELALLAMIHAGPRDDSPRLVYADWLEEHGEPLCAEFLRVEAEYRQVGMGNSRSLWLYDRQWALERELIAVCPEWIVLVNRDLFIPPRLCKEGKRAAIAITEFMVMERRVRTNGCTAFIPPRQWEKEQRLDVGDAILVVLYEGSNLLPMFSCNGDDPLLLGRMADHLERHGFYVSMSGSYWATVEKGRKLCSA